MMQLKATITCSWNSGRGTKLALAPPWINPRPLLQSLCTNVVRHSSSRQIQLWARWPPLGGPSVWSEDNTRAQP